MQSLAQVYCSIHSSDWFILVAIFYCRPCKRVHDSLLWIFILVNCSFARMSLLLILATYVHYYWVCQLRCFKRLQVKIKIPWSMATNLTWCRRREPNAQNFISLATGASIPKRSITICEHLKPYTGLSWVTPKAGL